MKDSKLTPEQETTLKSQVFDATHPGTLLHDFALVLDYVGEKGVKAGGKYNLLPIDAILALDGRLAQPLRLDLERPQLRSHPYLQGLHLLFRASELGRVEGKGDKARLVVDPVVLQSWNQLNPTEQYFALLEAWLLISAPGMIGMRDRADIAVLHGWLFGLRLMVSLGQATFSQPQLTFALFRHEETYNGALAHLFGLVSIDHSAIPGRVWAPANPQITPFGHAMIVLLDIAAHALLEEEEEENPDESDEEPVHTWLQPTFQPYFPAWQTNLLAPPPPPVQEGVYVFKVSLGKEVWRRIALAQDHTLADLLGAILHSIKFDSDHLYEFTYRDSMGRKVQAGDSRSESDVAADEVELGTLPLKPGESMDLLYDFGDSWRFKVKLERIDPPGKLRKLPKVLESHGTAPEQYPNWE